MRTVQELNTSKTLASQRARVLLVGAGPGDPELLTLKAVRALGDADVILYDELVDRAILEHARPEALLIHVGKRGGRPSWKQADIHELILEHAANAKTIVRLKGGDPMVFGRGGEEIAALRSAGIEVEVIPGITAAVAASASTQVTLTHRDFSRTVTFLSGADISDSVVGPMISTGLYRPLLRCFIVKKVFSADPPLSILVMMWTQVTGPCTGFSLFPSKSG